MWFDASCTAQDLDLSFDGDGAPVEALALLDLDSVVDWDDRRLLAAVSPRARRRALVGVATGPLPPAASALLACLTTSVVETALPGSSSYVEVRSAPTAAEHLLQRTRSAPRATLALDSLLRVTASCQAEDGVAAESFAYSMLLGGPEFAAWRRDRPIRGSRGPRGTVTIARRGDTLSVVLDDPARRNAFSTALRSGLVEALRLAADDTTLHTLELSGAGACFSSGGDLDEFGSALDLAAAHAIRLDQSAGLAVHQVKERVHALLHGTCIGAGIEVPAFAQRVTARPGTTFCLPELDLGLVPGAGGSVSLTHRIGRWRTAYMVLSGAQIDTETAARWGLIDAID